MQRFFSASRLIVSRERKIQTMGNKKRSKPDHSASSGESATGGKRTKSVQELLGNHSNPSEIGSSPKSTDQQPGASAFVSDMETPKAKLNFDEKVMDDAPNWAKELISSVRSLQVEIKRIGDIAENTQKAVKDASASNANLKKDVTSLTSKVKTLENECDLLLSENTELREKLLLLEFHQRRNNLVFDGIEECGVTESGRDCFDKIMSCISGIPNLNVDSIRIDRCHRLGPAVPNKCRSIIAKFNWFGDLVDVMNGRSYLPDGIFVSEDYPDEWLDRRQLLRPILKQAKSIPRFQGKCRLVRDKLIIDNRQYTVAPVNNLHDLPSEIIPSDSCEKRNENTIAFLGPHSVFSNFHQANFVEGGVRYSCSEQMIQAEKAAMFNDRQSLEKIMKCKNPYKIKKAGSRIRGFVRDTWHASCKDIALRAVKAKFTQNINLAKLLKSTGSLLIVESSPDRLWGTGLHLRSNSCLDRSKWNGNGLMSEVLSMVRDTINM